MVEETVEFLRYRMQYLKDIKYEVFPWEPAYYYYVTTTDDIDIFPFHDFRESIAQKAAEERRKARLAGEGAFAMPVELTIYENLERFYTPITLMNKQGEALAMY